MADKLIKMTEDELSKMRRVDLRQSAVALGMSHTECSEAPSKKLIDFILSAQEGGGKAAGKRGAAAAESKPARGRRAEPKEEEDEVEPAPRGRRGRVEEPEEDEEVEDDEPEEKEEEPAPRGRRGRVEEPEEKAPARGAGAAGRGRRGAAEPEASKPEGGTAELLIRLNAIGSIQDELHKMVTAQAKSLFVLNGLVQEVLLEMKFPEKELKGLIEDLEGDFAKGKG